MYNKLLITNLKFNIMKSLKVKIIALIVATGMISYNLMAQKAGKNVPQNVVTAFSAQYPQVQLKKWKTTRDTYIALFILNGKKYMASYSPDGNWVNTERMIRHTASLPDGVMSFIKTNGYASWHIDQLEKLQTPSQSIYMVMVDNHSGNPDGYENAGSSVDKTLYFSNNGSFIKAN
jgi:hypothetical protein